MANDAVLASAIGSLRGTSEQTLNLTSENNIELQQINRNFNEFFEQMRKDRLTGNDVPDTATDKGSVASSMSSLGGSLKDMMSFPTLASVIAGFMASNFGLVGMKDMTAKIKGAMNIGKIGTMVSDRIRNVIRGIRNAITHKLGLTDLNGKRIPWNGAMQDPETGKMMKSNLNKFQTKFMRLGWAVQNFLKPLTTFMTSAGDKIGAFATKIGTVVGEQAGKIKDYIKNSRIGKIVGGFLNSALLRVVAWGMAVYDGIKEAIFGIEQADAKDEGWVSKSIRAAFGFIGGASGSFIGGLLDLVVGAIGLITKGVAKLFFPDSFNEDGTYNEETFLGNFMKRLDEFSFTEMILDGIRGLTDLIATWFNDKIAAITDYFNTPDDENPTIIAQKKRMEQREEMERLREEKQALRDAEKKGSTNVSDNSTKTEITNSQTTVDAGAAEDPSAKREARKNGLG